MVEFHSGIRLRLLIAKDPNEPLRAWKVENVGGVVGSLYLRYNNPCRDASAQPMETTVEGHTLNQAQSSIDFSVIARPLDSLLVALGNKIEREWPVSLATVRGGQALFLLTLRTAEATYRSLRFLCADKPPDPNRRLEFSISVPPLNRTILDNLFTVLF